MAIVKPPASTVDDRVRIPRAQATVLVAVPAREALVEELARQIALAAEQVPERAVDLAVVRGLEPIVPLVVEQELQIDPPAAAPGHRRDRRVARERQLDRVVVAVVAIALVLEMYRPAAVAARSAAAVAVRRALRVLAEEVAWVAAGLAEAEDVAAVAEGRECPGLFSTTQSSLVLTS